MKAVENYVIEEDQKSIPWRKVFKKENSEYSEAGLTLRGARHKVDLSQSKLAEKLGVPQANISAMEHGRRTIGKEMAKRLAKILGTDYRVLL